MCVSVCVNVKYMVYTVEQFNYPVFINVIIQSNHIEEPPTAEMKKQYEVNSVSHSIEHEKTKQALKV